VARSREWRRRALVGTFAVPSQTDVLLAVFAAVKFSAMRRKWTLLSRCESCGSTFGHLTVVPAGQGGVRSAGEILSAIVNQTRHKNLSACPLAQSLKLDFASELQLITGAKIPTSSDGHGGRWELRTKHGRCNHWALKR
jgi:hypothetical protein